MTVVPHLTNLSLPLGVTWSCGDDESGLRLPLTWSLGTSPGGTDVFANMPSNASASSMEAVLAEATAAGRLGHYTGLRVGVWYYVSVAVTNGAGETSRFAAAPVVVDTSPPVIVGTSGGGSGSRCRA